MSLKEVLEEMLDKQESTTVLGKKRGIEIVMVVRSTQYLMGNLQVPFIDLYCLN